MAVRIAILSNCQHESLAVALRAILPDADITSLDLNGVGGEPAARAALAASLSACDHVISQDISPDYGPLSTRALRPAARNYHLLPAFYFGGFHPDCVAVRLDHTPMGGPAGGLHSRIVVAGMLAGLQAGEIVDLFNTLVYARLGYFDALAEHSALLIEKYSAYAIDLSALVPKWRAGGCFMTSPHHPKMVVFLDLARIACEMMQLAPGTAPPVTSLRDPLAAFSTMPFLPEIAARCGMQAEGVFRDTLPARPLTLTEFVQGSVRALARAPLCCLRAVQGVPEALDRLGLSAVPPQHRVTAETPGSQCVLSWHGTILRIEAASSLLVHEKLWPPGADCADFVMTPMADADGRARAEILGGLDIAPATAPGTVRITRGGRAMVAEAALLAVPFRGDGTGIDETFLTLGVAEIASLRDILSRDWTWQGTTRRAAAARIRLRPGFILDFGIFAVNLIQAPPLPVPAGELGGEGYRFDVASGPITIRPVAEPGHAREIALLPDPQRRMPNEAGSVPEFRTALQASWSLGAGDEILHPPLTASDGDTAWLFERCAWPGGLPAGLRQNRAALRRMPGKAVLLSPGVEGVVFDGLGAMAAVAVPTLQRGQTLPAGLRQEEGALLIEADRLAAAPIISGPLAVCLGPDWRGRDGWLIEVALRLHCLAPFLPRGARLLVPPGFAAAAGEHLALLRALGLDGIAVLEAPGPLCRLEDAIWLDNGALAETPAAILSGFRARIAALFPAPAGPPSRLYVKRDARIAENKAFDAFLSAQGFTTIVPEALSPAARIAAFRGADMVIGAHGDELADIVFCQDGTRVLEMSPRGQFRPRYWMLADKCGLIHGVLPCSTEGGGFAGALQLDVGRLRALFRVLRLCGA